MATIESINQGVINSVTSVGGGTSIINAIGWLFVGLLAIGAVGYGLWYWNDRKKYNRIIIANEIVNGYFQQTYKDVGRSVKLGKGGFEVIFIKKLKTWKIAQGARSGRNIYTFYIMPDGYWYPGQLSANIKTLTDAGGLITVTTTNPNMRSQYTALEKQIDDLHKEKGKFWEKYGQWVMTGAFIAIMGIFMWLTFRELSPALGAFSNLADKMTTLADAMSKLAVNLHNSGGTGLVAGQ